ncbi:MAG: hypothetical protein RIM84_09955 [Alphaproteobacteria bacterium]
MAINKAGLNPADSDLASTAGVPAAPTGAFAFYAGLFCITAATLMLQLIQTRLLSVVAWYHLAFFVISTAMFGLSAGAVWVYLRRARYTERTLSHDLAHYATAFAVTMAAALALQMTLAPVTRPTMTAVLVWSQIAALLSLPYFFAGVVVSLALTRSPFPVGRVYGVDLAGAAFGCFGVLGLLNLCDAPSAVLWTAVLAAAGAMLFARSGIGGLPDRAPRFAGLLRRRSLWLVVLAVAATLNTMDDRRLGLYPIYAKGELQIENLPWFEDWNSFSRVVTMPPVTEAPQMWGPSPTFDAAAWTVAASDLNIDGAAGTAAYGIAGDLSRAGFLKSDITNLAYYLPERRHAAIIGVGGGRDVISARLFGVPQVTGVEINPIFIEQHRAGTAFGDFVGLERLGGVSLVVDEARSWFASSRESFDLIQMSLIDTWAATGAGAFTLSENGLYTVEAWRIFLRRLTPKGVFTVSRWYAPTHVTETGRMVSLAVAALLDDGVARPRDHIYLVATGAVATLVVSRAPFDTEALSALREATARLDYQPLIVPGEVPASETLRNIVEAPDAAALEAYTRSRTLDLTPPRDDRPFFFNQLPFYHAPKVIALALAGRSPGVGWGNLVATATLLLLFLIAFAFVAATIVYPLRDAVRDTGRRLATGGTVYFALIGLGFMFVEIGLLQRFSVFLGHPIYALALVLFSLILFTGVGSLLSDRLGIERPTRFAAWALLSAGYVLAQTWWLPPLLLTLDSSGLVVRGLVAVAAILPAGLLLGYGFPTGMRLVSVVDQRPTPWFWGINGACGVLASALAVACSIAYGIGATLSLGAVCYLLLIPAALVIGFPRAPAIPVGSGAAGR